MSSTKIELMPPYSNDFKSGYLNINKEPRRVLSLIGENGYRTSVSYARYLMSVKLGRYLKKSEHVDHIDNNKMNDSVDNLQILSHKDNNIKKNKYLGISRSFKELECPICGVTFVRESRNILFKIKNGITPTCSRSCGGKQAHITKNMRLYRL